MPDKPTVDKDLIRELAELLEETGLTEIEVGEGDSVLRVSRAASAAAAAPVMPAPSPVATASDAPSPGGDVSAVHPGAVTSPMVGTAYVAPEPGAVPFINVGDQVSDGQTLFIVEAMKTMNPIPAPRSGKVVQILVTDGSPVEYGEVLVILE
jgi:acetyl-CoA carboxylase biotin carboxyl carrier protein